MIRFSVTALFICFLSVAVTAQDASDKSVYYYNSFQEYRFKEDIDSSLYFIRLLAANQTPQWTVLRSLSEITAFESNWQPPADPLELWSGYDKQQKNLRILLDSMVADKDKVIAKAAQPLYLWLKIRQNEQNDTALINYTTQFIATQLSAKDIYENSAGRYALLIYKIICLHPALNNLSAQLFTTTYNKLRANQLTGDTLSGVALNKRAWYRFMFAYANYVKANEFVQQHNNKLAEIYFKKAFDYSPDFTDQVHDIGYSFDMIYLLETVKRTFQDDYLNFLVANSKDKTKTLAALVATSLAVPVYKEKLHTYYDANFAHGETFASFWMKSVNEKLKPVKGFSLKQLDGNIFSTAKNKGSWVLIDFWGSWCGPCKAEHPDLQKLYKEILTKNTSFAVLTIACYDNENKVKDYMAEHQYSFPVAMADDKIIAAYKVESFPTKMLVTPQGNYVIIPMNTDWVDFIKKYASL